MNNRSEVENWLDVHSPVLINGYKRLYVRGGLLAHHRSRPDRAWQCAASRSHPDISNAEGGRPEQGALVRTRERARPGGAYRDPVRGAIKRPWSSDSLREGLLKSSFHQTYVYAREQSSEIPNFIFLYGSANSIQLCQRVIQWNTKYAYFNQGFVRHSPGSIIYLRMHVRSESISRCLLG
jgi:hypothetical protein